jgi:hypothetical protein
MSEQIMWAVKSPDGRILFDTMDKTESWAKINFVGGSADRWPAFYGAGYRCVEVEIRETGRVRVTEVQDGP